MSAVVKVKRSLMAETYTHITMAYITGPTYMYVMYLFS